MTQKKDMVHPLEAFFDIEPAVMKQEMSYEMVEVEKSKSAIIEKDEEDKVIDKKIDDVYEAAMGAFQLQSAYTEIIEPRYAARNAEVAANYLNIALGAATSRAKVKSDRIRNSNFIPFNNGSGGKNTTNVIVADRNSILQALTIDIDGKKEEWLFRFQKKKYSIYGVCCPPYYIVDWPRLGTFQSDDGAFLLKLLINVEKNIDVNDVFIIVLIITDIGNVIDAFKIYPDNKVMRIKKSQKASFEMSLKNFKSLVQKSFNNSVSEFQYKADEIRIGNHFDYKTISKEILNILMHFYIKYSPSYDYK